MSLSRLVLLFGALDRSVADQCGTAPNAICLSNLRPSIIPSLTVV